MSKNYIYSYEKLHESEHGKKILHNIYKNLKYITGKKVYIEMTDYNSHNTPWSHEEFKRSCGGLYCPKGGSVYCYVFELGEKAFKHEKGWIEIKL